VPLAVVKNTGLTLGDLYKRFNRTALSAADFDEACGYLEYLKGTTDFDVITQRAFLSAATIAYMRSFVPSRGANSDKATPLPSISPQKLFPERSYRDLHKQLDDLRNEVVAHSTYERQPVAYSGGDEGGGFMYMHYPFDVTRAGLDLAAWRIMVERCRLHCYNELNRLAKSIREQGGTAQQFVLPNLGK
jgi:hypothetical protein